MTTAKKTAQASFTAGEKVVYPAHGVGQITAIEDQEVAGFKLQVFVVYFDQGKLTLRVPLAKAASAGMRKLSDSATVQQAFETLGGRPLPKRGIWNRRATEYQEKISSGRLAAVAEVVRDLYRSPDQEEASYSERQIYESAIEFLVKEVAAVKGMTETETLKAIEQELAKVPRVVSAIKSAKTADESKPDAA